MADGYQVEWIRPTHVYQRGNIRTAVAVTDYVFTSQKLATNSLLYFLSVFRSSSCPLPASAPTSQGPLGLPITPNIQGVLRGIAFPTIFFSSSTYLYHLSFPGAVRIEWGCAYREYRWRKAGGVACPKAKLYIRIRAEMQIKQQQSNSPAALSFRIRTNRWCGRRYIVRRSVLIDRLTAFCF